MALKLSFQADPPIPYHASSFHIKQGFKRGLQNSNISQSEVFDVVNFTENSIRSLLKIPEEFMVLFVKSRLIPLLEINKTKDQIISLDHGFETSLLTKEVDNISNQSIHLNSVDSAYRKEIESLRQSTQIIIPETDLLSGDFFGPNYIQSIKRLNSDTFLHLDISYSVPSSVIEYNSVDSFFFKTSYGFGLNNGPVVWLLKRSFFNQHNKYLESLKYIQLKELGKNIFCDPELDLIKVYALGQIATDFDNRNINILKNETTYKSIVIQKAIQKSATNDLVIKNPDHQSKNIIIFSSTQPVQKTRKIFESKGILLDYISKNESKYFIRIGNYPAHSKEQMELLADIIENN